MKSKYNVDLSGRKFGSLTVMNKTGIGFGGYNKWQCQCDCGNKLNANAYNLLKGYTKNCGPNHINLVGERFGKLIVTKREENSPGDSNKRWLCQCDCGGTKKVTTFFLTAGIVKSCGCLRRKSDAINRVLYHRYKTSSKKRKLLFLLSEADFFKLIASDCYYCGSKPSKEFKYKNRVLKYNGLDRIDNKEGYTKENSAPCCFVCNRAKGNKSLKEFISWVIGLRKLLKENQ